MSEWAWEEGFWGIGIIGRGEGKGGKRGKKDVRVTSCNNSGIGALTCCQCEHFSCFPQTCCAGSRNRDVVGDGSGITSSDTLANGLGVGGFQTAAGWGTDGDALWLKRLRSVVAKKVVVLELLLLTMLPVSVEPLAKMKIMSPQEPSSSSLEVEEPNWRRAMGVP